MHRLISFGIIGLCVARLCLAQDPAAAPSAANASTHVVVVRAHALIDGTSAQPRANQEILIQGDRITAVYAAGTRPPPPGAQVLDLGNATVLPGLIDNHLHIIRGGLNYNMELRWDGVRSLADAMAMLKRQVVITPPPQWVRVVGGFTAHQFVEKHLPTIEELNAVAPDTPVFLLHLYDRALLNGAVLRAVGYTKDTPDPPAGEIVRDAHGDPTGLLIAKPNANIKMGLR